MTTGPLAVSVPLSSVFPPRGGDEAKAASGESAFTETPLTPPPPPHLGESLYLICNRTSGAGQP